MSRETEMLQRIAKEHASELEEKSKNPEYKMMLDREECIRKLSVIMDSSYSDTTSLFDKEVNRYRNILRRSNF